MRPGSLESLRGLQTAIAEAVLPQLTTPFAQDTAGTLGMLIESLASEWDGLAEELHDDNLRMAGLLARAAPELRASAEGNESLRALVNFIEEPDSHSSESRRISVLTAENDRLRGKLERLIVALEDVEPDPRYAPLMGLRGDVYRHLRRVAAGGWSFWDVASFRERMASLRAEMEA
jgi:hypothetical protein